MSYSTFMTGAPATDFDNLSDFVLHLRGSSSQPDLLDKNINPLATQVLRLQAQLDQVNQQNRRQAQELEELKLEREKLQDYVVTVAHELGNPLHSATALVKLLQSDAGSQPNLHNSYLSLALASLEQTRLLVDDLLCESQIYQDMLDLELVPVDLRQLVKQSVAQFSVLAAAAEVRLEISYLPSSACTVLGSALRLKQCLGNLITNAIKYSPASTVVRISIDTVGENYWVSIEDQGCGIDAQKLNMIFDRYYRVKEGTGHQVSGYGIGLSITKLLVELHGGQIGVSSQSGQGSRFWFSLSRLDHIS